MEQPSPPRDNGDYATPPHSGQYTQTFPTAPSNPDPAQYATYPSSPNNTSINDRPSGARLMSYDSDGKTPSGSGSEEKVRPWVSDANGNSNGGEQQGGKQGQWQGGKEGQGNGEGGTVEPWVPIPLRTWFWVPLVLLMAAGGIGFEVALHFSKHNRGWATKSDGNATAGVLHYVYTLPPVAISMIFSGLWAWTDMEIRKIQPYVDLAQGDAPPQRSLLLDYTRNHTFIVWTIAARNRHWLVSLGSLLVLLTFGFQPLAAALFNVQDLFFADPPTTVTNLGVVSLNQDQNFQDLTSFLTAAGYASANVLYNIGDPAFIHGGYTVAPFQLPDVQNGTVFANTSAVLSQPNCTGPDTPVSMLQVSTVTGTWNNTATFGDCTFAWQVDKTTQHLFGSNPVGQNTTGCASLLSTPEQFRPVLFWYFSYDTVPPTAAVSLCTASISLLDASVTVDLASRNLTSVTPLGPLGSVLSGNNNNNNNNNNGDGGSSGNTGNTAQFAGNLTGPPVDGRAYNGLFFNLTDPDVFTDAREAAIQLMLPAAVFEAAVQAGLDEAFEDGLFAGLSLSVYTTYLALVAKTVYFLPFEQPLTVQTMTIHKRLFLSPVAVHLLATAMFVLAVLGTILHLWHRQERQVLLLGSAPGTIASAVALGAQTGVAGVLAGRTRAADIARALQDKRFRIDARSGRIVMVGEPGYESAVSPPAERLAFGINIPRAISVKARRISTGWVHGAGQGRRRRATMEGGQGGGGPATVVDEEA